MEDDVPPPPPSQTFSDLDLMDEIFLGNSWIEAPDFSDLLQPNTSTSTSPFGSSGFSPLFELTPNPILPENDNQDEPQIDNFDNPILPENDNQDDNFDATQSLAPVSVDVSKFPLQIGDFEAANPGTSWWIQPRSPLSSMKERLDHALRNIKESQGDSDVLVQIWVPVRIGGHQVLTTIGQPFWLDPDCQQLASYRSASMKYHFSAEANSQEALGLPGRVFLGKVPEWTPDVRYFSSSEYPRVGHAQHFDVRGSIALPIFERDSRACLGVVEVVRTTQKSNYSADLENICNALQAVDLRSSDVLSISRPKMSSDSHQGALPEIREVLRVVCETHKLPLAQTWIPCIQQDKKGSRHSDENFRHCVSTVDIACYVKDTSMLGFHEACSEHHLLRGQGVAGKAFTTNQPCFSQDITSLSKIEYPLSHHARMFKLRAAVAIRLRSVHTGNASFVLEFFLPVNCIGDEEQKLMLNSLSNTIEHVCQTLRVVTAKELEDEAMLQNSEAIPPDVPLNKTFLEGVQGQSSNNILSVGGSAIDVSGEGPSWISNIMDAEQKRERNIFSLTNSLELSKRNTREFSVTAHWDHQEDVLTDRKILSKVKQHHHESVKGTSDLRDSVTDNPGLSNSGKTTEKRRTKTEKTLSLQVLRQYFAGSLKDAAKSLGVCPTTLKRICRNHGINRWPSRKIQKVGHSLQKLQVVIDSVHGAQGAFQFSSLYENFTKTSGQSNLLSGSSMLSALKQDEQPDTYNIRPEHEVRISSHASASNSSSSSRSQTSSSSHCCSSGSKQSTQEAQFVIKQDVPPQEDRSGSLKRAHSQVELHLQIEEAPISLTRSQSHETVGEYNILRNLSPPLETKGGLLRIKAIYGEEKVRFRLQPTWDFQELRQEIVRRFNVSNMSSVDIKYLDDESEWVLLTCDADLEECIEVYKSSGTHTIKINVCVPSQQSSDTSLGGT